MNFNQNIAVFDIEANGLLDTVTQVHCLVTYSNGQVKRWHNSTLLDRDGNIEEGLKFLSGHDLIIGHNIIGYDLIVLKKLYNWTPTKYLDSFIISQMLFANEMSSHGLEEWGKKFGVPKPAQEQWELFNSEMLNRCTKDVEINFRLWLKCKAELEKDNWDWDKAIRLEHKVYEIYSEHGTEWLIDLPLLDKKIHHYELEYERINNRLRLLKAPTVIPGREVKALTKSGQHSVAAINYDAIGDFCKLEFKPFEPSSVKQLVDYLLSVGWKPQSFTPKNAPSLRDDPLIGVPQHIAVHISDFRDCIHRLGVLQGFKKRAKEDGTIKMFSYTCGTNTARFRHSVVANIQPEFKDLFIAPKGYKIVGCDASQLEAKIEGHYTFPYDDGAYSKYLLEMDVHQFNADMWGVSRTEAKAPFYAMCVPEDTQILTKSGWKHHTELSLGELVLTYNHITNKKEWKPLQDKVVMTGEVFEFGNTHKTFKATADHTWFVKRYKHTKKHGRVDPKIFRKVTSTLNQEDMIIMNAPFNTLQDTDNFDYDIKNNLKYDTNWSTIILQMSHQQRKAWLNAFLLAEGTNKFREGECNEWSWVQNKGEIAEAAILCSYLVNDGQIHISDKIGTNKEMYNVRLGHKQHITCQNFTSKSLGTQTVWCPKTENGSWVMRQGNVITITGNSYGAGSGKLAKMLDISEERAKEIIQMHYETWHGLSDFIKHIEKKMEDRGFVTTGRFGRKDLDESKTPWLVGIDGRKLYVRGMHKLKNTLIQSAGSICMKYAYCWLANHIKKEQLDAKIVMFYHDSFDLIVIDDEHTINRVKELLVRSLKEAATYFKLRIPLTAEAKVGRSWYDTK